MLLSETTNMLKHFHLSKSSKEKLWTFIKAWWALTVYFPLCLLTVAVMLLWVDGYEALDGPMPRYSNGRWKLGSSDIITILGFVLKILEWITGAWSTAVLWKCARIVHHLSEKKARDKALGLVLEWNWPRFKGSSDLRIVMNLSLWIVLLPSLFGPVLEGSLNWQSSSEFGGTVSVASGSPTANFARWRYITNGLGRAAVDRAAAFASLAWQNATITKDNTSQGNRTCRHIVNDNQLPPGSALHNVTMPCIVIHNITWPVLDDGMPIALQKFIHDSGNLSVSGDSPLSYIDNPGVAVLFDPTNKTLPLPPVLSPPINTSFIIISTPIYPDSFMFSGSMAAIILTSKRYFFEPHLLDPFGYSHLNNNATDGVQLSAEAGGWIPDRYYTYLNVNFTVGVTTPETSTYVTSRVVDGGTDPQAFDIQAGPWVKQALYLLPDVMTAVAVMNTTSLDTWNNLFNYTEMLIRYSYLGAWDMLQRTYDNNSTNLTATTLELRLQASVSWTRVMAWFIVNFVFTLTGAAVLYLQKNVDIPELKYIDGPTKYLKLQGSLKADNGEEEDPLVNNKTSINMQEVDLDLHVQRNSASPDVNSPNRRVTT